jgi:cytochrome b subunit of formate dehydrogenase
MRPSREDWTELRERLRYYVGRRADPPHAGQVGYAEKLEYLALMWGLVIMAVTGLALWFEGFVLRFLPKSFTDVATVIHFYEAVLATLAILVWHFYFVIFDPVVYPMDPAWLTGRSAPGRAAERTPAVRAPAVRRTEEPPADPPASRAAP